MSLLAEVKLEEHYSEMLNYVRAINLAWKHMDEGEQAHCKELGNDLYDTWDKLEHCYRTHDEDQFEYMMALFLSLMDDYRQYATWVTIKNDHT